jgi:hypothetical protein
MNTPAPNRRQWLGLFVGLLVTGLVLFTLVSVVVVTRNSEKNAANSQTLALLQDCLTPGGECFKRQKKQTAGVVGVIGKGDVMSAAAAAWCAAERPGQTFEQILRCTVDHVKTAKRGRP